MTEYHKIDTVFKRDPATNNKRLIFGDYSRPEFEYLKDNQWEFTEKVDGTNIRVIVENVTDVETGAAVGWMHYGGRTNDAQIPVKLIEGLNDMFLRIHSEVIDAFPEGVVLYGEGYGAGIQKGGANYRKDQSFVLFDVKVGPWWLQRADVEDVAGKLRIDVVPIIGRGTLSDMLTYAQHGFSSKWGAFPAEGIVARPATELVGRDGKRIITKIKARDFAQGAA